MKEKIKCYRFDSKTEFSQLLEKYGNGYFAHVPEIPTRREEFSGYLYKKSEICSGGWTSAKDITLDPNAYVNHVAISFADAMDLGNKMEGQIEIAKSLLGKTVKFETNVEFTVKDIKVLFSDTQPNVTANTSKVLKTQGFVVVVTNGIHFVSVTDVRLAPEFIDFKLNDSYSAKIYKDKVVVGCQTFTKEVVLALAGLLTKSK